MSTPIRILFVCMGNICRSPTAEGVFRQQVAQAGLQARFEIDSAGTHNYHPGAAPDARAQRHAQQRGYDLSALRARVLTAADGAHFDWVLVMDHDNEAAARRIVGAAHAHKVRRLTTFCQQPQLQQMAEVPDPYYGGAAGFEQVLDLVEDASAGLLAFLREKSG